MSSSAARSKARVSSGPLSKSLPLTPSTSKTSPRYSFDHLLTALWTSISITTPVSLLYQFHRSPASAFLSPAFETISVGFLAPENPPISYFDDGAAQVSNGSKSLDVILESDSIPFDLFARLPDRFAIVTIRLGTLKNGSAHRFTTSAPCLQRQLCFLVLLSVSAIHGSTHSPLVGGVQPSPRSRSVHSSMLVKLTFLSFF